MAFSGIILKKMWSYVVFAGVILKKMEIRGYSGKMLKKIKFKHFFMCSLTDKFLCLTLQKCAQVGRFWIFYTGLAQIGTLLHV